MLYMQETRSHSARGPKYEQTIMGEGGGVVAVAVYWTWDGKITDEAYQSLTQ